MMKKKKQLKINYLFKTIKNIFSLLFSSSPCASYEPKPSSYKCPCRYHKRKRYEYELRLASKHGDNVAVHRENTGKNNGATVLFITDGRSPYEYEGEQVQDGTSKNSMKGDVVVLGDKGEDYDATGLHIINRRINEEDDKFCDGDRLSWRDVYALIKSKSDEHGNKVAEFEDVDERSERFIEEFRKQLRIQKTLSDEV